MYRRAISTINKKANQEIRSMNPAYKWTVEIWHKGKLLFSDPYNTTLTGAKESLRLNRGRFKDWTETHIFLVD